jgi:hypothetical protein
MVPNADINNDNGENSSFSSNLSSFVHLLHYKSLIYEKITKNVTETWLFYELMELLSHRIDLKNQRSICRLS